MAEDRKEMSAMGMVAAKPNPTGPVDEAGSEVTAEEQSGKDTVHSQQESMVQDYDETHDSQESGITTQVFRLNEDRAQVVRLESSSYFSEHVCG